MKLLRVPEPFPGADSVGSAAEERKNPYGEVSESEIILGGCYRELEFREGKGEEMTLRKERMLIGQVAFNQMDILAGSWGKPPLEAMLYLGIDGARVEKMLTTSFEKVVQEGRRLNFTLLQKWLKWQMEALSATGRQDQINLIIEKIIRENAENLPGPKS